MNIRPIETSEHHLMEDFLYLAVHQPDPNNLIPRSVIDVPEIRNYISEFGTKSADFCLIAENNQEILGMVWVRILAEEIKGYGFVDAQTPEFAIAVKEGYRGQGIGEKLMQSMFKLLKNQGYEQCSLSVQKTNKAFNLYQRLGFETIDKNSEDYIMLKQLKEK